MAVVHFVNYKRGTQSRAAMRGVMLYVMQEKKTMWEGEPLVSGINSVNFETGKKLHIAKE